MTLSQPEGKERGNKRRKGTIQRNFLRDFLEGKI